MTSSGRRLGGKKYSMTGSVKQHKLLAEMEESVNFECLSGDASFWAAEGSKEGKEHSFVNCNVKTIPKICISLNTLNDVSWRISVSWAGVREGNWLIILLVVIMEYIIISHVAPPRHCRHYCTISLMTDTHTGRRNDQHEQQHQHSKGKYSVTSNK